MVIKKLTSCFALLILSISSFTASAATVDLVAYMDCAQANAGAGTCGAGGSGTGLALITYDDVSNLLSWDITWSGLAGNPSVQHFHGAALPDQNAGVRVNIGIGDGTSAVGSTTITEAYEAELLGGLWYVNLHSDLFPAGEIRGQVNVVPIPAAAWLFASAIAGLGFIRRRRAV